MGPLELTAQALPDEHAWHEDAPTADTYPGLQAAHEAWWVLYLPAGQAGQFAEPVLVV